VRVSVWRVAPPADRVPRARTLADPW